MIQCYLHLQKWLKLMTGKSCNLYLIPHPHYSQTEMAAKALLSLTQPLNISTATSTTTTTGGIDASILDRLMPSQQQQHQAALLQHLQRQQQLAAAGKR